MRIFVITFSYLPMEQNRFESKFQYRIRHLPGYLGWVDLDLVSSPSWWAATAATYCPSRMVEHPKSKSTQPRYPGTRWTLYMPSHLQRQCWDGKKVSL